MTPLSEWQNFYVVVGSSAGALIGLQFVLITLIASIPVRTGEQAGNAFATPTIVHFGAALMLAAVGCAPWKSSMGIAAAWGILGVFGLVYSVVVTRRMRRQTAYRPEFEDWLFHSLLPLIAYATVAGSGLAMQAQKENVAFAVAGASLLLLYIGIHNAWDAATYHVFVVREKNLRKQNEAPKSPSFTDNPEQSGF